MTTFKAGGPKVLVTHFVICNLCGNRVKFSFVKLVCFVSATIEKFETKGKAHDV